MLSIDFCTLRLPVRTERTINLGTFVPLQASPFQIVEKTFFSAEHSPFLVKSVTHRLGLRLGCILGRCPLYGAQIDLQCVWPIDS